MNKCCYTFSTAISFISGTLLHFKDFSLRKWYFLDPQWLAKLMAKVINHRAMDEESPFNDGMFVTTVL